MRTRSNGQPLSEAGIIEDALKLGKACAGEPGDTFSAEYFELRKDIAELVRRESRAAESSGFDAGMKLGFKVEHAQAVHAVQQAALYILGKDRGDGAIDLGVLGREVFAEYPAK